jgi:putative peptidoglycan lipid II flippase
MADDSAPRPTFRTGRAATIVGLAVMCSRVLGLAREIIFNALFGTQLMQYFIAAFRVPNLLRDLFAEGALSTAFITVFSKKIATEGQESAWRLANRIGTLTIAVMGIITLLGILLSDTLISLVAGGFVGETKSAYPGGDALLTAQLTATMFPFILMVSVAAQVMGMLNARRVFGWPAMASSFFNIGSIVGGLLIAFSMDRGFGPRALFGLAYGTLIGGFLQLAVQIPALRKVGYHPRLDFGWRDSGVADVLRNMAPAIIAASAVQVNVMVNTSFATHCAATEPGAVTFLNNAFRLMQLPLGMFGVAIGTVTLPFLSEKAALGHRSEFREALARGIRLVFFLTVPASAGLWMLSEPILSVIYQHGKVTAHDISQSAGALQFYAMGLAAYAGMKVLAPAFYAIGRRKTPMVISFASIGVNYGLNDLFLQWGWGFRGLALSTGIVALANFALLYFFMWREISRLETKRLLVTLAKIFVATDALILVCWGCDWLMLSQWAGMNFALRLTSLLLTITLAMGAFVLVAALLHLREMRDVLSALRRRLARKRGASGR